MVQICETERLVIRTLSLNDVPELTKILSDPDVMKHSIRGVCDEAATRRFIDWCLECYASHRIGPWALVEKGTDKLVGFCGVSPEEVNGVEEIGLGYRLAKQYWGMGLATEAVQAVLSVAFSQKQLASVVAVIEPDNGASLKVAEKAEFSQFDTIEFYARPVRLYRLTLQQWCSLHCNIANSTSA
ncbi:GNAT family N-acetyltransferase [Vreelandella alkaliphila]|uniref:GNAT family N-acetyltransferase n=1 Tax=Vreelandella alkaliphila TaxID=272774 RepID=UPI003F9DAA34